MRVVTVVGNRPQFVKAAAVWPRLDGRAEQILIHSGQHYDRELSEIFFDELGLAEPTRNLGVGPGTLAEQTVRIIERLNEAFRDYSPDAVLFFGDTTTSLATAIAAASSRLPAAHVEAGVRAFDRTSPEEVNRIAAESLTGLLLCPTRQAVRNLEAEGLGSRARFTGDVMLDVAQRFSGVAERRSRILEHLSLEPEGYIAATAHRAGNVDEPARLVRVVEVLEAACEIAPVVFPVHPRTRERLGTAGLLNRLSRAAPDLVMVDPLGYVDFTRLVRSALAVITDSGGIQKEAYVAGVPCVTLRRSTEWVETVESGWNRLVDLDPAATLTAMGELLDGRGSERPDTAVYGDGRAGARVADELASWVA